MQSFKNEVDRQYHELLQDILDNGHTVINERTGTGTKAVFGRQLRFNMQEGLPVITTKKMYFKGIIGELLWFLGNHLKQEKYQTLPVDNIKYLIDNNINIWVGDMYKAYLTWVDNYVKEIEEPPFEYVIDDPTQNRLRPLTEQEFIGIIKGDFHDKKYAYDFALKFGNLGPGYGWQWRRFGGDYDSYLQDFKNVIDIGFKLGSYQGIDQISQVIEKLKSNPFDRRLMVTAWNPKEVDKTVLPPCHYGFSLYVRELSEEEKVKYSSEGKKYALSLMERQRSVDTLLGLPFNITSYAILLELIAREVNMVADELIMSLENTHIYLNHIDAVKEQLSRTESFELPKLKINSDNRMDFLEIEDFEIQEYKSLGVIKAKLNN